MSTFELELISSRTARTSIALSDLDFALTAQFIIAWAGEAGEEKRLGWWRSDLISEFGGEDLFRRLMPSTWRWAVLQAAREAARRCDAEQRKLDHDSDRIISLYNLGFEVDERIEERLADLKRSGSDPKAVLPGLALFDAGWDRAHFLAWINGNGSVETKVTPIGRRIKSPLPSALEPKIRQLLAGLEPLAESYPLPHFRSPT